MTLSFSVFADLSSLSSRLPCISDIFITRELGIEGYPSRSSSTALARMLPSESLTDLLFRPIQACANDI